MKVKSSVQSLTVHVFSDEPVWKHLKEFPTNFVDEAMLEEKAKNMIIMLNTLYQNTKTQLAKYFTINEAAMIVECAGEHVFVPMMRVSSYKELLLSQVKKAIEKYNCHQKYQVDKDVMINKLNKLTEFECFTVIKMADEWHYRWLEDKNSGRVSNGPERTMKIFGIEEGLDEK
jgi:hypothetical protein